MSDTRRSIGRRLLPWFLAGLTAVALSLPVARFFWLTRSANPVRSGVRLAARLGCFSCHGFQGQGGIPDPGIDERVPGWGGGVWMMYVDGAQEIREFILDGNSRARAASTGVQTARRRAAIQMPPFRDLISERQLEELTAAFLVLSKMARPEAGSAAGRGFEIALRWECFSCHGPGGSGGLANPGSFTGFVPGFYGADFRHLVTSRGEFDAWVRRGEIDRLEENLLPRFFTRRQRLQMPAYERLTAAELDDLWAYVGWLDATGGGVAELLEDH